MPHLRKEAENVVALRVCVCEDVEQDCSRVRALPSASRCAQWMTQRVRTVVAVKKEGLYVNEQLAEQRQVLAVQLSQPVVSKARSLHGLNGGHPPARTFSFAPSTSQMMCAPR